MKPSLPALAAAAVLGATTLGAHAQSSVTVYGIIDLGGVVDSGATAGKSVRLSSGVARASRLGFKGVEDLGKGYKAGFTIETGYCADSAAGAPNFCSGNNQFMGRTAHGDLSGSFGHLSAGREYSLAYSNLGAIDPFGNGYSARVTNLLDGSAVRLNNAVQYHSPKFGGVVASAEFALGETTGNFAASRELGASVVWASGPAYVGAALYQANNANGHGIARRNWQLGGTYDFKVVRLHALLQKSDGDPTNEASLDVLEWMGGVSVPLGGGSLMASYLHHDDRGVKDHDATQAGIGYNYPLSKRTSVYASFAHIVNHNGATFKVGNQTETGTGNQAFSLGAMHSF